MIFNRIELEKYQITTTVLIIIIIKIGFSF